jgi:hypothetical protein
MSFRHRPNCLPSPAFSLENFRRGLSQTIRALRHGNFRLFIAGQIVSLVGTLDGAMGIGAVNRYPRACGQVRPRRAPESSFTALAALGAGFVLFSRSRSFHLALLLMTVIGFSVMRHIRKQYRATQK